MENVKLPNNHPSVKMGKTGLLFVNLGTPDDTTTPAVRRYLKEFLSDSRVVEANRLVWWFVLNFIILTFRPSKTAEVYKQVWMNDINESPLRYYTKKQAEKVAENFKKQGDLIIDYAMCYGNPSIESKIKALKEQGCTRLAIFPLYPHYCAATTGAVNDQVFRALMKMRWQPALRIAEPYHDHPLYIKALEKTMQEFLKGLDWTPDLILASYHGIPKEYFEKGDPYPCVCKKTTRLLRERLDMGDEEIMTTFQSRFGPKEWMQPYTDYTIDELAEKGMKNLAVITPGFASDCIETLEEIGIAAKESFLEKGGKNFALVPCLNDNKHSIDMLTGLTKEFLQGWV